MATAFKLPEDLTLMQEFQYTAEGLALEWNVSDQKIYRMFKDEPGVIRIGNGPRKMMRIPESVALRVYNRLKNK
jgi:hypothetical protein